MPTGGTRAIYICYLSLEDPLVATQVVAYLEGLAQRGHEIHLLTFDPELHPRRREQFARDLERRGIAWHSLRYHKRPSLPATIYDALRGAATTARLVRKHGLEVIHARSHVPAASALLAQRLTGARVLFDMRGLVAEEYVDAGRWQSGSLAFRITKRIERAALRRAAGIVVLTERVKRFLFGDDTPRRVRVIPCCADLQQLESHAGDSRRTREELGLDDRPAMIYVGKFTGYYLEREMVDFFSVARGVWPGLVFVVLTQADPTPIAEAFDRRSVAASEFRIERAAPDEIGRYLAVAEFGMSFVRPCFSKIASSPTKIGEYLGAGLPVVSTAGIGDVDALLAGNGVGVLVDTLSSGGYEEAARRLQPVLDDPGASARCRSVAESQLGLREVGIPRYDSLYRQVVDA